MSDKVYLITGGTGSFGKAFVRDLLTNHNPKQIRIFSRDEFKQHQMAQEFKDYRLEFLLGDVRDYDRLVTAMDGVDTVVHAAALKRIEKCERDPQEAVKTNVNGTINVAKAALAQKVSNAVLISTDKACYPINLYGATKLTAEKVWVQSNVYRGKSKPTKFSVVRYGNVVGSRGSVIPLFRDQAKSGVVQITDSRMTRYLVTLQQAVDLVHATIELQQGGEVFLPLLKATSISVLAAYVAPEARQVTIGLRPGEKLHETLFTAEEAGRMHMAEGFTIINPEYPTWAYEPYEVNFDGGFLTSEKALQLSEVELRTLVNAY